MAITNQKSIISYVPQPYHVNGSTSCGTIDVGDWDSVANAEGAFDPDLSSFATLETSNPLSAPFEFTLNFEQDASLFAELSALSIEPTLTVALLGCSLRYYEDDGGGSPDLSTERESIINYTITTNGITDTSRPDAAEGLSYNSSNKVRSFCGDEKQGIISGGLTNVVFTGHGAPIDSASGPVSVTVQMNLSVLPNTADHARFFLGHLFIGYEIPINLDPRTFSWALAVQNDRFKSRDQGSKSSDGALVRTASGEIRAINFFDILATKIAQVAAGTIEEIYNTPNFFDLVKVNTSYPPLFVPYPTAPVGNIGPVIDPGGTLNTDLYLTARQNFFSIYGFLDPLEFQTGEFRDGLNSEYRAKFRIRETR